MTSRTKLELTWVGKENRPRLEPRILREDPTLSYHAAQRIGENGYFDNVLVQGDNLLALKALEHKFIGRVKCIYIDPPFNTGAAFEHYDDGLEHSAWLSLMKDRLEILKVLLTDDGVIFVHIDDKEMAYLRILMDEVFLRSNFLNMIVVKTSDPSGHKTVNPSPYSQTEYILMYARNRYSYYYEQQYVPSEYDSMYNKFIEGRDKHFSQWVIQPLSEVAARSMNYDSADDARRKIGRLDFQAQVAKFALENANCVFQSTAISDAAGRSIVDIRNESARNPGIVYYVPRQQYEDIYILDGRQIYFYSSKVKEIDGKLVPAKPLTNLWADIPWNGIANEGGVSFKNGKKPERLIRRCIELSTKPGDIVLDSFAGSGTTGAVAHKMCRRWIMIELGDHSHTHIAPRLRKIIDGTDNTGVTALVNWRGGGGFRYYRLAPSLLEQDRFGNWVINKKYDSAMLAEAICKLEGFTYFPSDTIYWQQGRSSERDFIYVTTQTLTREQLAQISEEVGSDRSLLICCSAFRVKDTSEFPNLTLKKIPKAVLHRCEWGKDDYSLTLSSVLTPTTDTAEAATPGSTTLQAPMFEMPEEV